MANISKINGFKPVKHITGAPYNGQANIYATSASDGTALFVGDVVKLAADGNTQGIQFVAAATAGVAGTGAPVLGVVVGIKPNYTNENFSSTGVAASTAATLLVCDDPRATYEVESDATLAITDVGSNVDIISTEATLSGVMYISNYKIDGSSGVTTAATPVQVVKLLKGATSGTLGDRALVRLNDTSIVPGATGV